jgi:hypothetical protein
MAGCNAYQQSILSNKQPGSLSRTKICSYHRFAS